MHGVDRRIGACHCRAGPLECNGAQDEHASTQEAHRPRWRW
jgi:hypothetical protein